MVKNNKHIFSIFLLIGFSVVFLANSGGSPGKRTGSPSDGSSCATNGGCHGPKTPENLEMISTTIPETGYVPGAEYEVIISASKMNINRYGFEIVSENNSGVGVGEFMDNTDVNATNNRATHKFGSINGAGGKTWTITWKAPAAGTGEVKFYVAVLAANGNGTTSGDNVLLDNVNVTEGQSTASVTSLSNLQLTLFPNPASNILHISGYNDDSSVLTILNNEGKKVIRQNFQDRIDVSMLEAGVYYLQLESTNLVVKRQFIKQNK